MFTLKNAFRSVRRLATVLALVAASTFLVGKGTLMATPAPAPAAQDKALIYAGWFGNTIPTPSYIAANLAFLETQPFNGLVVYLRNSNLTINATTGVMKNVPMSQEAIASVLDPIRDVNFAQLKENFAYIIGNSPPDFFDDWSIPVQNFANLAKALNEAGIKGIVFDNEQYFSPWAAYPQGIKYPAISMADYQTQARVRGQQVMQAMVAEFPSIVVLTLHGPYISEPDAPWQLKFPSVVNYNAFMGPFFAGMQEGIGSQATNVDGGEIYDLRSASDFEKSYDWRRNDMASDAVNCTFLPAALRATWADTVSIGFGVYDCPSGGQAMNSSIMTSTLTNALQQSDKYVWLYTEAMTFLKAPGAGGASQEWVDAVRAAVPATSSDPGDPQAPAGFGGATASGTSSGGSSSSCGLLGIEVVPILMILGFLRMMRRRIGAV